MDTLHEDSSKLIVGIFFGGKTAEHEISLLSAKNVLAALDREKFEPVLIGIDRQGQWHRSDASGENDSLAVDETAAVLAMTPGSGTLVDTEGKTLKIDVAFPVLHGPMGEDGSIQGLFELADIPYVGPGILGSAVGMDKEVMKRLLTEADIPSAPFIALKSHEEINLPAIFATLGTPVFVKPANMGSSVGVSKAWNEEELLKAMTEAFLYDSKILVEQAVAGDEIECAVLGNEKPQASAVGHIIPKNDDFYSYDAKYIDEDGAILEIPARLSDELIEKVQTRAVEAFQVLGAEGMSRVDMFVTKDGEILVNEINTIPGFTKISMYPKLWEEAGLPVKDLVTRLIELAIERREGRAALKTSR